MPKSDKWIKAQIEQGMITNTTETTNHGLSSGAEGYGYDVRLGQHFKRAIGSQIIAPKDTDKEVVYQQHYVLPKDQKPQEPECYTRYREKIVDEIEGITLTEAEIQQVAQYEKELLQEQELRASLFGGGLIDTPQDLIYQDHYDIPPHTAVLAVSMERFKIPRDTLMIMQGKSTYARGGLILNTTPFDPEWEGVATLCLVNPTNHILRVYPGQGIAKAIFLEASEVCELSYADKGGKYQGANGVQAGTVLPEDGVTINV